VLSEEEIKEYLEKINQTIEQGEVPDVIFFTAQYYADEGKINQLVNVLLHEIKEARLLVKDLKADVEKLRADFSGRVVH